MDETVLVERTQAKGRVLAEKWSQMPGKFIRGYQESTKPIDFLKGLEDDRERALAAHLLENTWREISSLDESVRTNMIAGWTANQARLAA